MTSTFRLVVGVAGAVGVVLALELAPALQRLLDPLDILLARATEHLLTSMDMAVLRSGTVLTHPDGFGYRVGYECSGIRPAAVIAMMIFVVRATACQRVVGILLALVIIEALNLGRLVHLYWLGVHQPEAFWMAHHVTWNIIAVSAVLVYLAVWLCLTAPRDGARDRGPPRIPRTRRVLPPTQAQPTERHAFFCPTGVTPRTDLLNDRAPLARVDSKGLVDKMGANISFWLVISRLSDIAPQRARSSAG